ncbi:MAG: cytochrome c maturation protein CcmE [Halomonadaceae bacterium]|nr:MAG: cytochrome c maturation protein CcmE [Halomonadaceae bacterium]
MNPKRKKRLLLVGGLVCGLSLAVGLSLMALRDNINLFYTPSDIAAGLAPEERNIRAGGLVEDGSVKRDPASLRVDFMITDMESTVPVVYEGILPDLFREGQGVVALGTMVEGVFHARQVLARHDEEYMPPEVADALERAERLRAVRESGDGEQQDGAGSYRSSSDNGSGYNSAYSSGYGDSDSTDDGDEYKGSAE